MKTEHLHCLTRQTAQLYRHTICNHAENASEFSNKLLLLHLHWAHVNCTQSELEKKCFFLSHFYKFSAEVFENFLAYIMTNLRLQQNLTKHQRDRRVSSLFVQKWCFSCLERDFSKYLLAGIFLFGANFQNLFQI